VIIVDSEVEHIDHDAAWEAALAGNQDGLQQLLDEADELYEQGMILPMPFAQ
jgi:hypothetical protein